MQVCAAQAAQALSLCQPWPELLLREVFALNHNSRLYF